MISAKNLEAFIPEYPDVTSDRFIYDLARKKEFYEYRLEPSEATPTQPGQLLSHQISLKRFFSRETPYSEALIFQGLGAGKTCTSSAIVENFKVADVAGDQRKPALVLVKSNDLARIYKQDIANICTYETYTPKAKAKELERGASMTENAKNYRLNRAIEESYEIEPIESFLKALPTDELIKKRYSNRVIIIDESHAIRIQPKKKKGDNVKSSLYDILHNFLHTIEGCIILLLTGTPIWDQTSEFSAQMNLILPLDQQLPTGNAFDKRYFDDEGNLINQDELKERFRGRISFLRSMVTTAKREEKGMTAPWTSHIRIYPDGMSEFQAAYAREAREKIETKEIKVKGKMIERETKGGTVLKLARDAAKMVIPQFDSNDTIVGGIYGQDAFASVAVKKMKKHGKDGSSNTVNIYGISDVRLQKELRENLSEYSATFASIIDEIERNPNEIAFVYNELVTGVGGAIMFALCLQLRGFIWAKTANDIEKPSPKDRKRFAVMTSDAQTTSLPKQIQDMINSAGKADNKYASRLQVIIGSEKIALGFSIKNVRQFHLSEPHWNIASAEQAMFRGIRFGSHDALPEKERYIKIFRHAAVERAGEGENGFGFEQGYPKNQAFTDYETTDVYIYKIAEKKDYMDAQIYRIAEEVAFDCPLNYKRNVLEQDEDGTRACNYKECNYQCDAFPEPIKEDENGNELKVWDYSIKEEDLDYSTYNLFYASAKIKTMIDSIVLLFKSYFSIHINMAKDLLSVPNEETNIFLQAIDIIINSRILIRNRFGFGCYLKEKGNMLFLDNNISPVSNYPECSYIENPLITEKTSMEDLIEIMELTRDQPNIDNFCSDPTIENFEQISFKTRIVLLEALFAMKHTKNFDSNKKQREIAKIILGNMDNNIYEMSDGTSVHILYTEEFTGISYNVSAKNIKPSGRMRYFIPPASHNKTGIWDYVDAEKEIIYIEEIKDILKALGEDGMKDNKYGVFGWISKKDGSFRITTRGGQSKGKTKGMTCKTFHVEDLIDIMVNKLHHLPKENITYNKLSKQELIKNIVGKPGYKQYKKDLDSKDIGYLRKLLTLLYMERKDICEELKRWFGEHNLLFTR